MKRWFLAATGIAALLAGALLAGGVASAEEGSVSVSGTGVIAAQGDGLAHLHGRMVFKGAARAAVLLVKDDAGDASVDVSGYGEHIELPDGTDVYFGFHGQATVMGSNVHVVVVGDDIRFRAAGRGRAYLKGQGQYWVNGIGPFPWPTAGGESSF